MKKILIFHTSVGLGHKVIAENIAWHLSETGFNVFLADIGQVQKGRFEHYVVGIHQFINRYLPGLWAFLYNYGHYIILPFRVFIASFNYKLALAYIQQHNPDLIISTQTTASAVVSYLKQKNLYQGKFAIAFSDYHLHKYWIYSNADFYLANIEEQKKQMVDMGISENKIYVCGITLKPKIEVKVEGIRLKLGIQKTQKVILIGTGSLGLGFNLDDLKRLSNIKNVKIIFACGKNHELLATVKKLNINNVIALPFFTPMDELYAIADIFIGKPGGLSTAEALAWNLPLLVTFALPGQEDLNIKYLSVRKLILLRVENFTYQVEHELVTGNFRNQLKSNYYAEEIVGKAQEIINAVRHNI